MKSVYNSLLPIAIGAYFNALSVFSTKRVAKRAYTLFCSPRKGRVTPLQSEFLNGAMHESVRLGSEEIQTYRWEGSREKVLLLHGWESNACRWRNLIGFLQREGFEIIALDAPAHGNSSGNLFNVIQYTEATNKIVGRYQPQFIIGHSVGGMTALYHQYRYPHNSLRKIISIGAPSEFSDVMKRYQNLLRFNDRVLNALDIFYQDNFGFTMEEFSTADYARDIAIPGLLIHDELDEIAPFWASEKVHAQWKNSVLIKTQGLGHSMHQEQVNHRIIDFLKS